MSKIMLVLALLMASLTAACRDAREACYLWSTVGECESNQQYMSANCAASCGQCDEDEPVQLVVAAGGAAARPDASALLRDSGDASIVLVRRELADIELLPLGIVPPDRIVALAAGELHLVMLTANGAVITWGDGRMGQLGRPSSPSRAPFTQRAPGRMSWPLPTPRDAPAVGIGAGHMHSAAVLHGGTLMMWGDNSHSQCGVSFEETPVDDAPLDLEMLDAVVAMPLQVPLPAAAAAAAVSCGEVHTLVLTADGDVYAFGDNGYGQCGNVTEHVTTEPLLVPLPLDVGETATAVHAGAFHSLVTTSTGRLLAFGDNSYGQLGGARQQGFMHSLMQEAQAGVRELDEDAFETELAHAASVEPIELHLEPGETLAAATTFAFHSAALTDRGRLLMWGDNTYGQLGIEAANKSDVGSSHSAVPVSPASGSFASAVALGEYHTLVLTNASEVLSFGLNDRNQLARMRGAQWDSFPSEARWRGPLPDDGAEPPPAAVISSAFFSAVLSSQGHVFVWGEMPLGGARRGPNATATVAPPDADSAAAADEEARDEEALSFAELGEDVRVSAVCIGGFHMVAQTAKGEILSWGENAVGQLCRASEQDIDMVPALVSVAGTSSSSVVGCGGFHSLVAMPAAALGAPESLSPAAPAAPSEPSHASAELRSGATVAGCGEGHDGSHTAGEPHAQRLSTAPDGGDAAEEGHGEGGVLSWLRLPGVVASADAIASLEAGHMHSLARTRLGRVFSWGANERGQLGFAPPPQRTSRDAQQLFAPHEVPFDHPVQVVHVSAGANHNIAVTSDGTLFSWGDNSFGQLMHATAGTIGHKPEAARLPAARVGSSVASASAGAFHTVVVLRGGDVCAFGDNSHGQQGRRAPNRANACSVVQGVDHVSAGELHTIALTDGGDVLTWGDNQRAQCGRSGGTTFACPATSPPRPRTPIPMPRVPPWPNRHPELPLLSSPGRVVLPLDAGEVAVRVTAGGYRGAVLSSAGRLLIVGLADTELDAEEELFDDEEEDDGEMSEGLSMGRRPRVRLHGEQSEEDAVPFAAGRRPGRKRHREPQVWSTTPEALHE